MGFIIGLLTFILVVDCIVLVFLVLIQLPKKEAGAGLAFGGAASDALFGAGSGTVLTKVTKYAAGIFFVLAIFLSFIQVHYRTRGISNFQRSLTEGGNAPAALPVTPGTAAQPGATGTNIPIMPPAVESTNLPATPLVTPPPVTPVVTNSTSPAK
ncbi:MAG TPA: preprotein translocase subunit SecG [Verrucomicrobiae bacterium]